MSERKLISKIQFFEDRLLRSRDFREQERLSQDLRAMRAQLARLRRAS